MSRLFAALAVLAYTSAAPAADPKPLWTIEANTDLKEKVQIRWLGFTPDGKSLIARADMGATGTLGVWDTATRTLQRRPAVEPVENLSLRSTRDAVLPDGKVLLRGSGALELTPGKGTVRAALPHVAGVKSVSGVWYCAESKQVVWALDTNATGRFDYGNTLFAVVPAGSTAEQLRGKIPPTVELDTAVDALAVSPNASRVAVALSDEEDRRYFSLQVLASKEKLELTELARVPIGRRSIWRIDFAPNGKTLATGSSVGSVLLWDVEKAGKDWKPRTEIECSKHRGLSTLVFHPDDRTLYALTFDRPDSPNLFVIDVASGKLVAKHALGGQVLCAAFTADGKALVTGDFEGRIAAWDAEALRKP